MNRYCTHCGAPAAENAAFCASCGKPVEGTPSGTPQSTPRPRAEVDLAPILRALAKLGLTDPSSTAAMWRLPALAGIGAFAAAAAAALVAGVFLRLGGVSIPIFSGSLLAILYAGQHIGLHVSSSVFDEFDSLVSSSGSISASAVGALLIVGAALAASGAWLVRRQPQLGRYGGAAVAPFFALACFVGSFIVGWDSGGVKMSASHAGSLFLPLFWGAVFGALGSLVAVEGREFWRVPLGAATSRFSSVRAPLALGTAHLRLALKLLVLAVVAAQILLFAEHPHVGTQIIFSRHVFAYAIAVVLLLPHAVAMGLVASTGAALHLQVGAASVGYDTHIGIFGAPSFVPVSHLWLLLLLVPLVAACLPGYRAAAETEGTVGMRLRAAAIAGVPFVVVCWIAAVLTQTTIDQGIGGFGGSVALTFAGSAFVLPLVWGIGGASGAGLVQLWRSGALTVPSVAVATAGSGYPAPAMPAGEPNAPASVAHAPAFCRSCGHQVTDGRRFCPECGASAE